jgi:hypothetical protein
VNWRPGKAHSQDTMTGRTPRELAVGGFVADHVQEASRRCRRDCRLAVMSVPSEVGLTVGQRPV